MKKSKNESSYSDQFIESTLQKPRYVPVLCISMELSLCVVRVVEMCSQCEKYATVSNMFPDKRHRCPFV